MACGRIPGIRAVSSPFRALRSRNYRLFFGQGISLIGSWVRLVLRRSVVGSAARRPSPSAASAPVGSLLGGSLAERVGVEAAFVASGAACVVTTLAGARRSTRDRAP